MQPWEEISQSDEFKTLAPEDQEYAKLGWFQDNIASSEGYQALSEDDRRNAIMGFWGDEVQQALPKEPIPERGVAGELGASLVRGAYGSAEQYARVGRVLGIDTTEFIKDMKDKGEEYAATKHGKIWDSINQGVESTVQSITAGVPAAVAGTAIGGPVGTAVGFAGGAGVTFSLAEYDQFMEEAEALGIPRESVQKEALISAIAEGGFEALTDIAGAKIYGFIGKSGVTEPAKRTAKELLKKFTKNIAKLSSVEVPGEMATSAVQAHERQQAGMD